MTPRKDPAAVALGRRGGAAGTPAQQEARARTLARNRLERQPTGGTGETWAVRLPVPPADRAAYLAAARAAGVSVGAWVAGAMRDGLGNKAKTEK